MKIPRSQVGQDIWFSLIIPGFKSRRGNPFIWFAFALCSFRIIIYCSWGYDSCSGCKTSRARFSLDPVLLFSLHLLGFGLWALGFGLWSVVDVREQEVRLSCFCFCSFHQFSIHQLLETVHSSKHIRTRGRVVKESRSGRDLL
jgi:hypothetical protein